MIDIFSLRFSGGLLKAFFIHFYVGPALKLFIQYLYYFFSFNSNIVGRFTLFEKVVTILDLKLF
jgi:hypothetical protein